MCMKLKSTMVDEKKVGRMSLIPMVVEQDESWESVLTIFTRVYLKDRIIFLGSAIDDDVANFVIAQLLFLAADDPEKDIHLYINSPGGSVTAGMGIFDTMQFIKPDVSTICVGMAASMGSLASDSRCQRQAICAAEQRSYDSSAAWRR